MFLLSTIVITLAVALPKLQCAPSGEEIKPNGQLDFPPERIHDCLARNWMELLHPPISGDDKLQLIKELDDGQEVTSYSVQLMGPLLYVNQSLK